MTLTDVAVELYALPPGDFTAARKVRAQQARADGDRDLAARITALRKPTLAAWAVDLLVRQRPDQVEELLALGPRLLGAQAARAGDELRELNRQHHTLMAALREDARRLAADAGQRLGDTVDVPLESTLRAAMTDPDAAAAVRSGLLVSDLVSTGFGPVEVGDAVAVPDAPPLTSPPADAEPAAAPAAPDEDDAVALPRRRGAARTAPRPRGGATTGPAGRPADGTERADGADEPGQPGQPDQPAGTEPAPAAARATARRAADDERAAARSAKAEREAAAREAAHRRERERAARDLEAAQQRAAAADRALADAAAALEDATRRRADLDAEVERLTAELAEARDRRDAADREERRAATAREAATRTADTADRRARAARERLDALG